MSNGETDKKKKKQVDADPNEQMELLSLMLANSMLNMAKEEETPEKSEEALEQEDGVYQLAEFQPSSVSSTGLKSVFSTSGLPLVKIPHFSQEELAQRENIRAVTSASLANIYRQYDGVKYEFGGKEVNTPEDGIDCSGLAYRGLESVMKNLGVTQRDYGSFYNSSEGQLVAAIKKGVPIRTKEDLTASSFKGGELILTDNGQTSFDKNRKFSVDHALVTFKKGDQVFVLQSTGDKGVHTMPIEDWMRTNHAKEIYVADMVDIVQTAQSFEPAMMAKNDITRDEFRNNFAHLETDKDLTIKPETNLTLG